MLEIRCYDELFNDGSEAIESCAVCWHDTTFWWGLGCMPVCSSCAKYMDFDTAYRLAKEESYGPLPDAKFIGGRYFKA